MSFGYDYNDGGINNQKLAILGLFIAASQQERPADRQVHLPLIHSRDQHDEMSSRERFDAAFWGDLFHAFADRWNIAIVPSPEVTAREPMQPAGWNYFASASTHVGSFFHRREALQVDIAADFFRSLVPRIRSSRVFQRLCHEVYVRRRIRVAAQLRIEEDWATYSRITLDATIAEPEDYLLTAEAIVAKIKKSIPDPGREIFVMSDERYLPAPKQEIARRVLEATGIAILWKSDILSPDAIEALSPLDASLLDFEAGMLAQHFVGLSRSTFSNMICLEGHLRAFGTGRQDWIYNLAGPRLGLRTDQGTHFMPQHVCAAPDQATAALQPTTVSGSDHISSPPPSAPTRSISPGSSFAMQIGPLGALAQKYGSDKWGAHHYTPHYELHFAPFRDAAINLLEIGIGGYSDPSAGGSSLRMWRDYFTNARIAALDYFDKSPHAGDRITVYQGDQSDAHLLETISAKSGPFDIIIDDGSHLNAHVLESFRVLFPLLRDGGLYVVEDTQTAFWPKFGGSSDDLASPRTSMGFFKRLIDGLNHREIPRDGYEASYYDENILGMSFYHNLVFINKGDNSEESNLLSQFRFRPEAAHFADEA